MIELPKPNPKLDDEYWLEYTQILNSKALEEGKDLGELTRLGILFCEAISLKQRAEDEVAQNGLSIMNEKGQLIKNPAATMIFQAQKGIIDVTKRLDSLVAIQKKLPHGQKGNQNARRKPGLSVDDIEVK